MTKMRELYVKSTIFDNPNAKPTLKDYENDFKTQLNSLPIEVRKNVDINNSMLKSMLLMDTDKKLDSMEHYLKRINEWEKDFKSELQNFIKLKNNNLDIFTTIHNYIIENKVYYPVYKLNTLFCMFYRKTFTKFLLETSKNIKSSNYKTFRRYVNLVFIDLTASGYIDETNVKQMYKSKTLCLHPFQATHKGSNISPPIKYTIIDTIDLSNLIDDEKCWKYMLCEDYCIRMKPYKICYVESDTRLPHQDIMVDIFAKDFMKHYKIDLRKHSNYIGFFRTECIIKKDYPNHEIFKNCILVKDRIHKKDDKRYSIHIKYVYKQMAVLLHKKSLCNRYCITDKITHLFNQKSYNQKFLESIFNPKLQIEPVKNSLESNVISETESDSDSDGESDGIIESKCDSELSPKNNYNFNYNKHHSFNNEKSLIEQSVYNLIRNNEKAKKLFDLYTDINILKPISKCYTNRKYFNIILFNQDTKVVSQSYHAYLDGDNNITSITRIENLI